MNSSSFQASKEWSGKTCGSCVYYTELPKQNRTGIVSPVVMKECRRYPPFMLMVPVMGQGGRATVKPATAYPQMPENFPACAEHKEGFAEQ